MIENIESDDIHVFHIRIHVSLGDVIGIIQAPGEMGSIKIENIRGKSLSADSCGHPHQERPQNCK